MTSCPSEGRSHTSSVDAVTNSMSEYVQTVDDQRKKEPDDRSLQKCIGVT